MVSNTTTTTVQNNKVVLAVGAAGLTAVFATLMFAMSVAHVLGFNATDVGFLTASALLLITSVVLAFFGGDA